MADATLNTDLPRRSILAVAVSAGAFALKPAEPAAAHPDPTYPDPILPDPVLSDLGLSGPGLSADSRPDAARPADALPLTDQGDALLLRRVAAAGAAWAEQGRADARCKALCAGAASFEALPDKRAYLAAQVAYRKAAARFERACAAAFGPPARSLRGLHARLDLALRLTRESDLLDHPPYERLEAVLAELGALAEGRQAGEVRP